MNSFLELAERCEAAAGPDRELFEQAYAAINGASVATVIYRHGDLGDDPNYEKWEAARHFRELLDASAFLDAAMTLAGDEAVSVLLDAIDCCQEDEVSEWVKALPRFVTAAALRAHAAKEERR